LIPPAATAKVDVSGKAQLDVNVKAPPGTKVKGNGTGTLKDINIKSTAQMMPADASPMEE
jgi:hypothetical protein